MLCHTCTHPAGEHPEAGYCHCGCALYIRSDSPRAKLRTVAAECGWTWRQTSQVDEFRRGLGNYVTVIYTTTDGIFGVNTVDAYVPGAAEGVALSALVG